MIRLHMQVGQELEDVLTERDALKLVNQELAKRVTAPAEACTRCKEVSQHLQAPAFPLAARSTMAMIHVHHTIDTVRPE